ncbi:MAG: hypothetical protein P4L83_07745 [Nevskia sp.]|nr:hypothetical protein [Nevskia sp.]
MSKPHGRHGPRFGRAGAALIFAASGLLYAAGVATAAEETKADAVAELAGVVCSGCHGGGGVSKSPMFPRLAGQQEIYLASQLRAFKSKSRTDPEANNYMWGMATLVNDDMVDAFAHYYASLPPPPGIPGDPKLVEEGRLLFERDVPDRGIVACSGCHGSNAEGRDTYPRLAGQHAAYIVRQLQVMQRRLRTSAAHGMVKDLRPDEIKAVAVYVQSR